MPRIKFVLILVVMEDALAHGEPITYEHGRDKS